MRSDAPQSHIEEAMKLEVRAYVELFRIDLNPPGQAIFSLFLSPTREITWQGKIWSDSTPCKISETSVQAGGDTTRPKFSIVNPDGTWSRYVHQKYVDNAKVSRYRVLRPHIDSGEDIFQLSSWRISKVLSLNKDLVICELRTALDRQNFKIPADTYRPPNYPTVSIQ